jgi:hypothetical protein
MILHAWDLDLWQSVKPHNQGLYLSVLRKPNALLYELMRER